MSVVYFMFIIYKIVSLCDLRALICKNELSVLRYVDRRNLDARPIEYQVPIQEPAYPVFVPCPGSSRPKRKRDQPRACACRYNLPQPQPCTCKYNANQPQPCLCQCDVPQPSVCCCHAPSSIPRAFTDTIRPMKVEVKI